MLDGILLERAGLPAAVILTEPFVRSGREMADAQGCPDFPFSVVPHPIANQTDAVLKEWARGVAPAVASILLNGAP